MKVFREKEKISKVSNMEKAKRKVKFKTFTTEITAWRSYNQKQDLRHRGTEAAEDWWEKNNFNTEEPEKKKLRNV